MELENENGEYGIDLTAVIESSNDQSDFLSPEISDSKTIGQDLSIPNSVNIQQYSGFQDPIARNSSNQMNIPDIHGEGQRQALDETVIDNLRESLYPDTYTSHKKNILGSVNESILEEESPLSHFSFKTTYSALHSSSQASSLNGEYSVTISDDDKRGEPEMTGNLRSKGKHQSKDKESLDLNSSRPLGAAILRPSIWIGAQNKESTTPSSRSKLFTIETNDDMDLFPTRARDDVVFDSKPRYYHWKGRNSFLFYGTYMLGSQYYQVLYSALLIIGTWMAYFELIAPYLDSVNCYRLCFVMLQINLNGLLLSSFTEPGIIPRCYSMEMFVDPIYRTYLHRNAQKLNYCMTCKIIKPDRTRHCKYCDNCVRVFDHHCPWVGNCIGVRNYLYFFVFVLSVVVGALIVLGSSGIILFQTINGIPTNYPIVRLLAICAMIPWSMAIIIFSGSLLILHAILIFRRQTTCEFFRGIRSQADASTSPSRSNEGNNGHVNAIPQEVTRETGQNAYISNHCITICSPFFTNFLSSLTRTSNTILSSDGITSNMDTNEIHSRPTNIQDKIDSLMMESSSFDCLYPPETLLLPLYEERNDEDKDLDDNLAQVVAKAIQEHLPEI